MSYFIQDPEEMVNAISVASRLRTKHGYWMALYHSMSLMIWCRKGKTQHWSDEELHCVKFWWTVRNLIYKSR